MDIGVGARGSFNGVAYGYYTHLYIQSISSQWERDEIVHESRQALYKGPRMVTDMYYKHALLMEFDTPDDAAIVMAHLRFYRGEKSQLQYATPTSQMLLFPFVQQPIYSPPNTSWDARSLGHQISPSGIAVTSSQTQGPPPPQQVSGPFVPPPVPPVSQSQGPQVHHFDQAYPASPLGYSLPSVTESLLQAQSHPPPPEMLPSPPQAQPPLLPQAHSPLVPPPPINPTFANIPMDSQICKHVI
uniref:RRM domain-containing protein n=1 Tax=Brassica oleracea var. oleracea TaxID=109376 RepID=A0A0D3D6D5_BRAOL